jgi:hypothetical protein
MNTAYSMELELVGEDSKELDPVTGVDRVSEDSKELDPVTGGNRVDLENRNLERLQRT